MQSIRQFDADSAFLAFLKATNQKDITAEIFHVLTKNLIQQQIFLSGVSPVELYVPGIGEGFQAQEIAEVINQITGRTINIHGSDISDSFVKTATRRLTSMPYVNQLEVTIGDAFTYGSINLKRVDIATASHLLYYATSQNAVTNFVLNVIGTLKLDGLAILIHEAPDSIIAGLRSSYNPSFLSKPTLAVDTAAHQMGLPVYKLDYTSSLAFGDLRLIRSLKSPQTRDELKSDGDFEQTAQLMQFIFQRSLSELEREHLLQQAIDDVIDKLSPETNELEIRSQFQILLPATRADKQATEEHLLASIAVTASKIPQIKERYPNPVLTSSR